MYFNKRYKPINYSNPQRWSFLYRRFDDPLTAEADAEKHAIFMWELIKKTIEEIDLDVYRGIRFYHCPSVRARKRMRDIREAAYALVRLMYDIDYVRRYKQRVAAGRHVHVRKRPLNILRVPLPEPVILYPQKEKKKSDE